MCVVDIILLCVFELNSKSPVKRGFAELLLNNSGIEHSRADCSLPHAISSMTSGSTHRNNLGLNRPTAHLHRVAPCIILYIIMLRVQMNFNFKTEVKDGN
jgi:hypothetical protein